MVSGIGAALLMQLREMFKWYLFNCSAVASPGAMVFHAKALVHTTMINSTHFSVLAD